MAAELPPDLILPPEAQWHPGFDPAAATEAYLDTFPAAERAASDAYFEGGYWIELWGTLLAVAVFALFLQSGFARGLRNAMERRTRSPFLQTWLFAIVFWIAFSLIFLPWDAYVGFVREHQYGMSNQTAGAWLGEWAISLGLALVALPFAIAGIYALVRRVRERWVYWATGVTAVFMLFVILIEPIFIAPLFNDYHPLPKGELRDDILALARASDIPADDVYWFDASKQTKRISANVSGIGGTARIALNDNLLNGTSPPEIRAVMGHEMGHYALNHAWWLTLGLSLAYGIAYWAVNRMFATMRSRFGERHGVRDLADPAGLPLAFAIFAVVSLLLSPVANTIIRTAENQADAYGLDFAREPLGFASVAIRLGAYRKLAPGPVEEFLFFDHPSGHARVLRSMQWLADHPPATN